MTAPAKNPTLERVPLRHRGKAYEVVRDAHGVLRVTGQGRVMAPSGAVVRTLRAAYPAAFEAVPIRATASAVSSMAEALTIATDRHLVVRFGPDEVSETGGHFVTLADAQPATVKAAFIALVNLVIERE